MATRSPSVRCFAWISTRSMCSLLLFLALCLSACAGETQPAAHSRESGIVRGGIWIDDISQDPGSLLPNAFAGGGGASLIDNAIWTPLFSGDSTGHIIPGLVAFLPTLQNGGISPDLKTWTFTLRPGLKWSDGQPLDARDIDYSWRLWTNPKFADVSETVGFDLIRSTTISPDHLTITFHLTSPFSPFLSIWTDGAFAPLPAHLFSHIAPDQLPNSSQNLDPTVTSGPFMLIRSKPGSNYTVSRNPYYYRAAQGLPYLKQIIFRVTPDQDTILKDLQTGSIDSAWDLDLAKIDAYKALTNYTLSANPYSTGFEDIYFNFRNPILGHDLDVRKAIALAINRDSLIKIARHGWAIPLCTDHGPGLVPGYQKNVKCPPFDPTGALHMLQADGWKMGLDHVLTRDGQRLEFSYSTVAGSSWQMEDELIIQANLAAIGIKIDITNYPASTFFGSFLLAGNPQVYNLAENEDGLVYDGDDASLEACNQIPPNGTNYTFYCNPALDKLFLEEESTVDPTARQAIFDQIHQIYLTDFPFLVLYGREAIAMSKKTVHNYGPGTLGPETAGVWNWWCTDGIC